MNYFFNELHCRLEQIYDHDYKPEPIFYGNSSAFLGVELEVDNGNLTAEFLNKLLTTANSTNSIRIYLKEDATLNCGFEIVSHPMTLDYHKKYMNWGELFCILHRNAFESNNTQTCGLHIHINKSFFGVDNVTQIKYITKAIFFVEKFWRELQTLSRRSLHSCELFSFRLGFETIYSSPEVLYTLASNHHYCLNTQHKDTIEFRLFKGTINYSHFIAALELVFNICSFVRTVSNEDIKNMMWRDFTDYIKYEYNDLIEYLREYRLYIEK